MPHDGSFPPTWLSRGHCDPPLAFALYKLGDTKFGCMICDYPPAHRAGDPALCAVAQLNEITGIDMHVSVVPAAPDAQAAIVLSIPDLSL